MLLLLILRSPADFFVVALTVILAWLRSLIVSALMVMVPAAPVALSSVSAEIFPLSWSFKLLAKIVKFPAFTLPLVATEISPSC